VQTADGAGAQAQIRNYLTDPLSEEEWLEVLEILDAQPTELVRRDENFKASALHDDDIVTAEQVARVFAENPTLAQRPVLLRDGRAIIGRPKSLVEPFLA